MKRLLLLAGLAWPLRAPAQGQVVGQVVDSHTRHGFVGATVLLKYDSTVVKGTITDTAGRFRLLLVPIGHYQLEVQQVGYRSKVIEGLAVTQATSTDLTLAFPGPCMYQYQAGALPACVGGHTDQLIPIIYGLPGKRLLAQAKQGKVYLAGCQMTDCDSKYYCPRHKKQL